MNFISFIRLPSQSDFMILKNRYDRDTRSMTNLKVQVENVESTIKKLKSTTLSGKAEEICARYFIFFTVCEWVAATLRKAVRLMIQMHER